MTRTNWTRGNNGTGGQSDRRRWMEQYKIAIKKTANRVVKPATTYRSSLELTKLWGLVIYRQGRGATIIGLHTTVFYHAPAISQSISIFDKFCYIFCSSTLSSIVTLHLFVLIHFTCKFVLSTMYKHTLIVELLSLLFVGIVEIRAQCFFTGRSFISFYL